MCMLTLFFSDKTVMENVVDFISDVVPQVSNRCIYTFKQRSRSGKGSF